MGTRRVKVCDVFDTLQPKGLREIEVVVRERIEGVFAGIPKEPEIKELWTDTVAVGDRGAVRVIRIAKSATTPYVRKPKAEKGAGDV